MEIITAMIICKLAVFLALEIKKSHYFLVQNLDGLVEMIKTEPAAYKSATNPPHASRHLRAHPKLTDVSTTRTQGMDHERAAHPCPPTGWQHAH